MQALNANQPLSRNPDFLSRSHIANFKPKATQPVIETHVVQRLPPTHWFGMMHRYPAAICRTKVTHCHSCMTFLLPILVPARVIVATLPVPGESQELTLTHYRILHWERAPHHAGWMTIWMILVQVAHVLALPSHHTSMRMQKRQVGASPHIPEKELNH